MESIIIKEEELDISDVDESEMSLTQNNIGKIKTKKYECNECLSSFKCKSKFDVHMNTHTKQKKYECDQCPAVFYREVTAQKHKKAHVKYQATGITCAACDVWCQNLRSLQIHQRNHRVRIKCDMCPKTFRFRKNMLAHKVAVHNTSGLLKCPCCEYKFNDKKLLLEHIDTHTRQWSCNTCGEGFTCNKLLQKHKERVHQPKKEFICDLCSFVFDTSIGLRDHKKRHSFECRYICDLCGKGFTFSSRLTRHMITHSKERNFECDICGDKFKTTITLKNHLKTRHADKK